MTLNTVYLLWSFNNNNNGEFLYSAHTMLCALHTYYPWSLDLFIHVPFRLSFWSIQHLQLGTSRTHCHLCPTRYSFTPESSEACEGKVSCQRTQHRNNVPILRGEKHDISLKILHQAGFETARQAVTLAKLRALAIAPRPSLFDNQIGLLNTYLFWLTFHSRSSIICTHHLAICCRKQLRL